MSWIRCGLFQLNTVTGELRKGDTPVKIQQQPARILVLLAESAGKVVTREKIREAVWGQTNVAFEQSLNFCIRQIRMALNDDAENPTYIETVPRLGYRFIAPVQPSTEPIALPAARLRTRICVLPIRESEPGIADYFTLGLTEDLIAALCRLDPERIRVVAGPELAFEASIHPDLDGLRRELNLDYLLCGWVRRSDDSVRVCAQLHDLHDKSVLWSENYNGPAGDLPGLQERVVRRVGQSLALELLPSPISGARKYGRSPAAYDSYLKGRYFWHKMTPEGMRSAVRSFTEAFDIDPDCAPAYAGLADCYAQMGSIRLGMMKPLEALAKAKPLLGRAMDIDKTLPEAHCTLGLLKSWYDLDWRGADLEFQRALSLEPQSLTALIWRSLLLNALGKHSEAIASAQRALECDPTSPIVNAYLGVAQMMAGQFDLALRQLTQAIELDPLYYRAHMFFADTLCESNRPKEAIVPFERALALNPENLEALAFMGKAKALAGDHSGALEVLARLQATGTHFEPALLQASIYAGLEDCANMFKYLQLAFERRCAPLYLVATQSSFRRYRSDPRYVSFLELLDLPQRQSIP